MCCFGDMDKRSRVLFWLGAMKIREVYFNVGWRCGPADIQIDLCLWSSPFWPRCTMLYFSLEMSSLSIPYSFSPIARASLDLTHLALTTNWRYASRDSVSASKQLPFEYRYLVSSPACPTLIFEPGTQQNSTFVKLKLLDHKWQIPPKKC